MGIHSLSKQICAAYPPVIIIIILMSKFIMHVIKSPQTPYLAFKVATLQLKEVKEDKWKGDDENEKDPTIQLK